MDEVVLAGNNLALLVAADVLAERGRKVALLTDNRPLGGFFSGTQFGGLDFDLGMVMLEGEASAVAAAGLSTYDPAVRYDCARFTPQVARFVDSHVVRRRVATPQILVQGRLFPDYMMCNRTEAFGALVTSPPLEAARHGRAHAFHPGRKLQGRAYETLTYAQAAAFSHGAETQQVMFEPFLQKVANTQAGELLASYHRAAWVPLYYPETVCAASRGQSSLLQEYLFWIPAPGNTSTLVASLLRKIEQHPAVRVDRSRLQAVRPSGARVAAEFPDGRRVDSACFALGGAPERAVELLGIPAQRPVAQTSLQLDFFLVRQRCIGLPLTVLFIVDSQYRAYRLTDLDGSAGRDVEWHRVVMESGTAAGPVEAAVARDELSRLLALTDPAAARHVGQLQARNALFLPSRESLAETMSQLQALRHAAGPALLSGALCGVGVASLHDQVVQGLAIAEAFA